MAGKRTRRLEAHAARFARANGVGLCFIQGARLPDPHGLLVGSGKQTRFIRLRSAARLAEPEVEGIDLRSRKAIRNLIATHRAPQVDHPDDFHQTKAKATTISQHSALKSITEKEQLGA
jgi:hypothetical protein